MSYDEQRKDCELALNEIMNELCYELTKVASSYRFKSKLNQIRDPPILVRLKSQTDRDELISLSKSTFINKGLSEIEPKLERDARLICRKKNREEIDTGSSMRWKVKI